MDGILHKCVMRQSSWSQTRANQRCTSPKIPIYFKLNNRKDLHRTVLPLLLLTECSPFPRCAHNLLRSCCITLCLCNRCVRLSVFESELSPCQADANFSSSVYMLKDHKCRPGWRICFVQEKAKRSSRIWGGNTCILCSFMLRMYTFRERDTEIEDRQSFTLTTDSYVISQLGQSLSTSTKSKMGVRAAKENMCIGGELCHAVRRFAESTAQVLTVFLRRLGM